MKRIAHHIAALALTVVQSFSGIALAAPPCPSTYSNAPAPPAVIYGQPQPAYAAYPTSGNYEAAAPKTECPRCAAARRHQLQQPVVSGYPQSTPLYTPNAPGAAMAPRVLAGQVAPMVQQVPQHNFIPAPAAAGVPQSVLPAVVMPAPILPAAVPQAGFGGVAPTEAANAANFVIPAGPQAAAAGTPVAVEGQAAAAGINGDAALIAQQKICPVNGEPLHSMGGPIKVEVQGQVIFVCCEGCREALLDDPQSYLAGSEG